MERFNPRIHKDRRKGPDLWIVLMRGFGVFGWIALLTGLAFLDKARPTQAQFLDRYFYEKMNIPIQEKLNWDDRLLFHLFLAMCLGLVASLLGLALNRFRHHRTDDHYRFYLWFLALSSAVGILIYLF